MRPAGGWFDSSPKHYDYPCPACFPLAMTIANEVSQAPHPWGDSPGENHGDEHHGGHAYEACRTPLRRWGSRCTRYAPPPAVHTWSPPAPCATSAGKPRTSAALAAAIHRLARARVLARDPRCVCPGDGPDGCGRHHGLCGAPSTIADHWPLERVELIEAGLDPNDPARMRGLCKRCHDSKTARTKPSGFNGRSLR